MWTITKALNEYNQDGDYLYATFETKPTREELRILFYESNYDPNSLTNSDRNYRESFITHLLNGGGRIETEDTWYFLMEMKHAEKYPK